MSSWSLVSFAGFRACLIYMCLTVYEFFLFCLFIIIFIFILNYVLIVTFWIFIYYEIWILLNIYCFIWNYWIIYFVTCLEVLWVNSYQLVLHSQTPPGSHAWVSRHCYPIGCVIKSTHQGICSCSPIVNFLEVTFYHGMVTSVIFLIKKITLNRHIKHENLLSIYENMDHFQIMLLIVTCWKFQKT